MAKKRLSFKRRKALLVKRARCSSDCTPSGLSVADPIVLSDDEDADSGVRKVKRQCCLPTVSSDCTRSGLTIADPIVLSDDADSDSMSDEWNAATMFMDEHEPCPEKLRIVRKTLDLTQMLVSQRHFQQKENSMQCMLYALWNALGDNSVLSVPDMTNQVRAMNHLEWRPYMIQELTSMLKESGETVVAKRKGRALLKSLSVGGLTGRWNISILHEALVKHTNLRFRKVSPRVKGADYVDTVFSRKSIDTHHCVFVVTQFEYKNKTEGHVVIMKHGLVFDSERKEPFPLADYCDWGFIIAMYVLETNNSL